MSNDTHPIKFAPEATESGFRAVANDCFFNIFFKINGYFVIKQKIIFWVIIFNYPLIDKFLPSRRKNLKSKIFFYQSQNKSFSPSVLLMRFWQIPRSEILCKVHFFIEKNREIILPTVESFIA